MSTLGAGIAVAAVLIAIAVGHSGNPTTGSSAGASTPSSMTPAAFVTAAAKRTLAQSGAAVTLSGEVEDGSYDFPITGSGQLNFSSASAELDLNVSGSSLSITEKELLVAGTSYLDVELNGKNVVQQATGRPWLQLPLAPASGPASSQNPLTALATLEQQGATVRALGTESINGVICSGYSATPTVAAEVTQAQQEYQQLGLSAAQTSQALATIRQSKPPTITIWFDSDELLRETTVEMNVSGVNSAASPQGQVTIDVGDYGPPTTIAAPSASQTTTYQQFIAAAGTLGAGSKSA